MVNTFNSDFDGLVDKITGDRLSSTTITVNLDGLLNNPGQYNAARQALDMWSAFTGLKFVLVHDGSAQIDITNRYPGAFTTQDYASPSGKMLVNVTQFWYTGAPSGTDPWQTGYYGLQTFIHEIGHALGLEHGGNYNGGAPDYDRDALFRSDTWQYSVMSYFSQSNNWMEYATDLFLIGPMIADIEAIRKLYGPLTVNAGDTLYGAGESVLKGWTDFGKHPNTTYCINDTDGHDLVDFSNVQAGRELGWGLRGNVIDLRPGHFSDIGGHTGNVSIARGTIIEDARGSQLMDIIHGNDADNMLNGLGDNDMLYGGMGDDTLLGGAGDDYLEGNDGDDILEGGEGNDSFYGGDGNDVLRGGSGNDSMEGGQGADDYYVDSEQDQVSEFHTGNPAGADIVKKASDWIAYLKAPASQQNDRVYASIDYTLGDNLEVLVLTGNQRLDGTGNSLNNLITGNGNNNVLKGMEGSDRLWGGAGNDTLEGGTGDDWLDGGYARDTLTGGEGNDAFVFGVGFPKSASGGSSWGTLNASSDVVRDFVHLEDVIVLSRTAFAALNSGTTLAKNSFLLWTKGSYTANTRIIYDQSSSKLYYDADGSGKGFDKVVIASFDTKPVIDSSDFLLVA
ncbi:M10 family metallopeptidase [Gellertiella hungarica]|uniref:Serralysin n=1 Tax=Gellertiella hungarica TaxID=1572859 RepID=A0A7W6J274_9HYPH|nr:M10 family metallopeptidase [Gellertiella hungarica]MBB4063431.1 serralysin [Gellertiella hungarica]